MTSRQRILAAASGEPADHVPLTTWSFGFPAPPHLRWQTNGRDVSHWYSKRLEHIHTLDQPWTLEDDFNRTKAWLSIGIDDILDVSIPWSVDSAATWTDTRAEPGELDEYPVLVRQYQTPAGPLRHAVRQTGEDQGPGWVIQPNFVPLFEDYNIPRAVEHPISGPGDVDAIRHLYMPPDESACKWAAHRLAKVQQFADEAGVAVQAWSAFGMDAVVWLAGTEGAILMAMDQPEAFGQLVDTVAKTDLARTILAADHPGVDIVVQRGWYSSTDFWSPDLFDQYVYPHLAELTAAAHSRGKKFAYVMTTGVATLGPRLADAGVDILYFADPVQDGIALETARDLLAGTMTLVGGANALTLQSGDPDKIRDEVARAIDVLGPTNRFILHPVDAVFPDTPWEGLETMIDAWRQTQ